MSDTDSQDGFFASRNPATGELIGHVAIDDARAVAAKVEDARVAAASWSALTFSERRKRLIRWRREIAGRADELADLIHRENGKTKVDALQEIMLALSHLDHAAKRAVSALSPQKVSAGLMANFRATVHYRSLGVVAVIGPWNYPILTPMGSIAYALAAGNSVVFKPSELTSLVGEFLRETAAAALEIRGVVTVTTGFGETGSALAAASVDKIAFTGSPATGRKVMLAAAANLTPVILELGGKDPLIVASDADLDEAAEAAVWGAMTNAGQTCISIERCYVVEDVYDQFIERVVDEAKALSSGATDDAELGAITSPEQIATIRAHIDDAVGKGAEVLMGGVECIRESFVEPTILVGVDESMRVMREETFGPVLPIARVGTVDEAVNAANSTGFGLGSAVFGKRGVRDIAGQIRAGMTSINSALAFATIPSLPFGGTGESGFGRVHGDDGFREFSRVHSVAEKRMSIPFNLMSYRTPVDLYAKLVKMIGGLYGGGTIDKAGSWLSTIRSR